MSAVQMDISFALTICFGLARRDYTLGGSTIRTFQKCFGFGFRTAMSNLRATCSRVEGFVRPSLSFHCSKSSLHTD